jgi:hypothetical protein
LLLTGMVDVLRRAVAAWRLPSWIEPEKALLTVLVGLILCGAFVLVISLGGAAFEFA